LLRRCDAAVAACIGKMHIFRPTIWKYFDHLNII
jgi:hypothetical protein